MYTHNKQLVETYIYKLIRNICKIISIHNCNCDGWSQMFDNYGDCEETLTAGYSYDDYSSRDDFLNDVGYMEDDYS